MLRGTSACVLRATIAVLLAAVWLPRISGRTEKYASAEYWNGEYRKNTYTDEYEWYALPWPSLKPHLQSVLAPDGSSRMDVLVAGCGNSGISAAMARDGFAKRMVNVDISHVVIDQRRQAHPELDWEVGDITDLSGFDSFSWDFVFDKGALDAVRGNKDPVMTRQVFSSYKRVLRRDGTAAIVTSCMEDECLLELQAVFGSVEMVKIRKPNFEATKEKMARLNFTFELREFDVLYLASPGDAAEEL